MKKAPLVSIGVPVYNVAHVLRRCLDSIISQTLTDIEIILVNDASTDGSSAIMESYRAKDARIKCLSHKKNKGLPMTRQTAIHEAKGKYMGFVDSDDWIAPDMMEKLYREAERTQSDIVVCNYICTGDPKRSNKKALTLRKDTFSKSHPSFNIFPEGVNPTYWNKLFRRTLFFEKDLIFPQLFYAEDLIVTAQLYFFAQRISMVDEVLYYYDVSVLHDKQTRRLVESIRTELQAILFLFEFFTLRNKTKELKKYLLNRQMALYFYADCVIRSDNKEAKALLNRLIAVHYNSTSVIYRTKFFFGSRVISVMRKSYVLKKMLRWIKLVLRYS